MTNNFPIWKVVKLGIGLKTADDFRRAFKTACSMIGESANDIIGRATFIVSKFKKEVDLYAIKNDEEIIIECSLTKISINLKDKTALFNEYKKLGIKKVIYINPKLTKYAKSTFNKSGIIALKPEEFGEYLDGK